MDTKIKSLKDKIIAKEWVFQGSVLNQFKQCGKITCSCYEDREYWHGPYWIWTRKVNGKTVTKTLSVNQAKMVKKSIKDMKEIKQLIEKWKKLSLQHLKNI